MTDSKAPWLTRGGAIALMAAAAIALAACSGGGGLNEDEAAGLRGELEAAQLQATADAAARVTAVAEAALAQTAKETAEAEAKVARTAQEAAEAAKKLAEEIAAGQVSDAEALVKTAQKLAKDAVDAKAKADAALIEARAKQKEAEVERDAALADEATARQQLQVALAATTAEERRRLAAERQAEQQQQQLQQELTEAEQAELRARASRFGAVLDLEMDGATEEGTVTVSWRRGNSLTFKPEGTLDPGSAAPSVPGSWRSASFTGHSGTANALIDETVYLYTNIQAPSSRAFWKVHNVAVGASSPLSDSILNSDAVNDPKPTAAAQYITDPADSTMASGVRVSGTYDGVRGTFTCMAGGTCMGSKTGITLITLVGAPVDGVRSFAGGEWSFKPGSITTPVKAEDGADQDDAFLYFWRLVFHPG